MIRLLYILFVFLIVSGCECVPELDTDKITEPVDNAGLFIFNGISDLQKINIYSNDLKLYSDLGRYESSKKYIKFPVKNAGYLSVWNEDNTFRLINFPLDLTLGKYYTLILAGSSSEPEFILLNDFELSENERYFRVINISDVPVTVKSNNDENHELFTLNPLQYSPTRIWEENTCNFRFLSNEEVISEVEDKIMNGDILSYIFISDKKEPKLSSFYTKIQ